MQSPTAHEAQALTAAEADAASQKRTDFIYLILFLEAEQHAHTLNQQKRAIFKRNGYRETPYTKALSAARWALDDIARDKARNLTRDGHLLFAFQGTTVLQGGAA